MMHSNSLMAAWKCDFVKAVCFCLIGLTLSMYSTINECIHKSFSPCSYIPFFTSQSIAVNGKYVVLIQIGFSIIVLSVVGFIKLYSIKTQFT